MIEKKLIIPQTVRILFYVVDLKKHELFILFLKRKNSIIKGWEFPGGKIYDKVGNNSNIIKSVFLMSNLEYYDMVYRVAVKELMEETGFYVDDLDPFLFVGKVKYLGNYHYVFSIVKFIIESKFPDINISDEHSEYKWRNIRIINNLGDLTGLTKFILRNLKK